MAGWTDYIPDWSSKDKLRLCSTYDVTRALYSALNERLSVLVANVETVGYYPIPLPQKLRSVNSCFSDVVPRPSFFSQDFHRLFKAIGIRYVDTISNGGDYFYPESDPPVYNFSWNTLLSGENEITPIATVEAVELMWQYLEILNRLKYVQYDNVNFDIHWGGLILNNPTIKATAEIYMRDGEVWELDSSIDDEHTFLELKDILPSDNYRYVLKFTGTNGFQFKDW